MAGVQARPRSLRAVQPLQRLDDLAAAGFGLLALFLLALDDVLGRIGDEIWIAEFLIDALDVGVRLGLFLAEPRPLGREVDDALKRQGDDLPSDEKLHRAL